MYQLTGGHNWDGYDIKAASDVRDPQYTIHETSGSTLQLLASNKLCFNDKY